MNDIAPSLLRDKIKPRTCKNRTQNTERNLHTNGFLGFSDWKFFRVYAVFHIEIAGQRNGKWCFATLRSALSELASESFRIKIIICSVFCVLFYHVLCFIFCHCHFAIRKDAPVFYVGAYLSPNSFVDSRLIVLDSIIILGQNYLNAFLGIFQQRVWNSTTSIRPGTQII